eukprot:Nk52_evm1s299 gene=Nk52_evmTU1s299
MKGACKFMHHRALFLWLTYAMMSWGLVMVISIDFVGAADVATCSRPEMQAIQYNYTSLSDGSATAMLLNPTNQCPTLFLNSSKFETQCEIYQKCKSGIDDLAQRIQKCQHNICPMIVGCDSFLGQINFWDILCNLDSLSECGSDASSIKENIRSYAESCFTNLYSSIFSKSTCQLCRPLATGIATSMKKCYPKEAEDPFSRAGIAQTTDTLTTGMCLFVENFKSAGDSNMRRATSAFGLSVLVVTVLTTVLL